MSEINNSWLVQERVSGGEWTTTLWLPMALVTTIDGNSLTSANRFDISEARAALLVEQNKKASPDMEHRYIKDHLKEGRGAGERIVYVCDTYNSWQ